MGVSIHLRGKLKSAELWSPLSDEVSDICQSQGWQYRLIGPSERTIGDNLAAVDEDGLEMFEGILNASKLVGNAAGMMQGIVVKMHERCEPLELLFDENGILTSVITVITGRKARKYPFVFCKTQFAGALVHVQLINLLTYLKKKYFKKLDIYDDGGYYPGNDLATLQMRLGTIDNAIASINDFMENADTEIMASPDDMIKEIQDMFSRTFGDTINVKILKIDLNDHTISDATPDNETPPKKRSKRKKKGDEE